MSPRVLMSLLDLLVEVCRMDISNPFGLGIIAERKTTTVED